MIKAFQIPLFALLLGLSCLKGTAWPHDPDLGAVFEYGERLIKNPDDLEALRARGSTFRALEYFDDALLDLNRADELEPDHAETVAEIGICHYHLGAQDLATDFFTRAEALLSTAPTPPLSEEELVG